MVKQQVRDMLQSALLAAQSDGSLALPEIPEVTLEKPGSREHGDYFTNIAMLLAARERLAPGEVAARIIAHLPSMPEVVKRVEIAGPGFINIYLAPEALHAVLRAIRKQGKAYGRSKTGQGHKAQIEFVSANPNGPLHIGHGRAAVLGDVIARLMEWTGWQVTREYYINDATNSPQMLPLGRALYARYAQLRGREATQPEEGYAEKYIGEIARKIAEQEGDRYLLIPEAESVAHFAEIALQEMLERQKDELHRFGVDYDIWFSEKSLHQSGAVQQAIEAVKASGYTMEAEGALWLRSTAFGDDQDRVLLRSNGDTTYLAADTAYHFSKFARGFERVIDVWGPDHTAYVRRTKAAIAALGIEPERAEILIYQKVNLSEGDERVSLSKYGGEQIPLEDLLAAVGKDAARFFYLTRPLESSLDFDMKLARQQSRENPVYSIRSAYERIKVALDEAGEQKIPYTEPEVELSTLLGENAHYLMQILAQFPETVETAAALRQPHRVAGYLQTLAEAILDYSDSTAIMGEGVSEAERMARLALADASRIVMENSMTLLGMSTD